MCRERGTTTTLAYVILLGVATLLVSGLLFGVTGFVDDQTERVAREGMEVTGQRAAGAIETADRLVGATDANPNAVVVEQRLPTRIGQSTYTMTVVGTPPDQELELSARAGTNVTVQLTARIPVEQTSIQGGPIVVVFDPGPPAQLEVRSGV